MNTVEEIEFYSDDEQDSQQDQDSQQEQDSLHHSVIAVRRVLSHRGKEIAEVFVNVLDEFKVANKIGHITTDNQSNNDTFCEELEILLKKRKITLDVKKYHVRCLCHVINHVVNDILESNISMLPQETAEKPRSRRLSGERRPKKPKYFFRFFIFFNF